MNERTAMVLGAGMVGVSTALHLARRGWSVALVDRRGPGQETSYGNAGFIQRECAEPHPMPRDLATLARYALGRSNDARYHLSSFASHAAPLLAYWRNSRAGPYGRIADAYSKLIALSLDEHAALIVAAGADHLVARNGFYVLARDEAKLAALRAEAEHLNQRYGVTYAMLTASELSRAEPALLSAGVGALHWLQPWTVSDPGGLVEAYAALAQREGVAMMTGDAATLRPSGAGWVVDGSAGPIEAEVAVMALGPWSEGLAKTLGYSFPMVRKRGHHRHYAGGPTLSTPVVDEANGYALAPMTRGMRITTGAEFTRDGAPVDPTQSDFAEARARELIALGTSVESTPWHGTRPCMPDMLPVIGPAPRHKGLWLHFGHGHQGFTLGPASGRLIADMMSGVDPGLDMGAYAPARYDKASSPGA